MVSTDGRQATYDAQNRTEAAWHALRRPEGDGTWNLGGRTSPGQPAGVDAHYYADVTDNYYRTSLAATASTMTGTRMVSTAHFGKNYNNAFWNGAADDLRRRRRHVPRSASSRADWT